MEVRKLAVAVAGGALAAGSAGAVSLLSATAHAGETSLAMLDRLQPGLWQVVEHGGDRSRREICLTNGRQLVQIRHAAEACSRFIIEDGLNTVTVQYSCRGTGYGRTRIRYEQAGLAQVETQGLHNGLPFDIHAEARRVGTCSR